MIVYTLRMTQDPERLWPSPGCSSRTHTTPTRAPAPPSTPDSAQSTDPAKSTSPSPAHSIELVFRLTRSPTAKSVFLDASLGLRSTFPDGNPAQYENSPDASFRHQTHENARAQQTQQTRQTRHTPAPRREGRDLDWAPRRGAHPPLAALLVGWRPPTRRKQPCRRLTGPPGLGAPRGGRHTTRAHPRPQRPEERPQRLRKGSSRPRSGRTARAGPLGQDGATTGYGRTEARLGWGQAGRSRSAGVGGQRRAPPSQRQRAAERRLPRRKKAGGVGGPRTRPSRLAAAPRRQRCPLACVREVT